MIIMWKPQTDDTIKRMLLPKLETSTALTPQLDYISINQKITFLLSGSVVRLRN